MSQPIEIFFGSELGGVEAVLLARVAGKDPTPQQIALAYKLLGRSCVMDPLLCEMWDAVVVSSTEFAKKHKATPATARPDAVKLFFAALPN